MFAAIYMMVLHICLLQNEKVRFADIALGNVCIYVQRRRDVVARDMFCDIVASHHSAQRFRDCTTTIYDFNIESLFTNHAVS